jgi:hypothetical protein
MRQHITPHRMRLHVLECRVDAAPKHDVADEGQGQHGFTLPAPSLRDPRGSD